MSFEKKIEKKGDSQPRGYLTSLYLRKMEEWNAGIGIEEIGERGNDRKHSS